MTHKDMQDIVRSKLNDLRALYRIIDSISFTQCLLLDPNNLKLEEAIKNCDLELVREWMDDVVCAELCELTMRQLRALAAQLGLKYYSCLSKDELLIQIVQVKNVIKQTKTDVGRVSLGTNGIKAISD